ncbi:c-type cytochrome biogenesis protein CcsB, partial [Frankia sp. AgKG'84/4]|nr:c-type cytochrome biogenesis protein CcsB [Frankia sp. AgKG'84/4]
MAVNDGISSLSDHLFGCGMAAYAAAMLGYAAEFAFSRLGTRQTDAEVAAEVPAARAAADRPGVLVGVGTVAGAAGDADPAA